MNIFEKLNFKNIDMKVNLKKINKKVLYIPAVIILLLLAVLFVPAFGGKNLYSIITYKDEYYASLSEARQAVYDKMIVKDVKITERKTGTESFNTSTKKSVDDGSVLSNMDGIDVSDKDNYVRTLDFVYYTLEVSVGLNPDADVSPDEVLKGGVIRVRATVPLGPNGERYGSWEDDAWMQNESLNSNYNVVTASYYIPESESLVGGSQQLTFKMVASAYTTKLIENSEKVNFEVWMEGNKPDNSKSTAESFVKYDDELYITGKENYEIELKQGNINLEGEIDGVKGHYVNFAYIVNMKAVHKDSNEKGMVFPDFSDISNNLKMEYYYNDSVNGWTLVDESNSKYDYIMDNMKIIAINPNFDENENAYPLPSSNAAGLKTDEEDMGYFCYYLVGFNQYARNHFCTDSGNMTGNFKNGNLNLDITNLEFPLSSVMVGYAGSSAPFEKTYNYSGESLEYPFVSQVVEIFVPYYEDNGSYSYKLKLTVDEAITNDSEYEKLIPDNKESNNSVEMELVKNSGAKYTYSFTGGDIAYYTGSNNDISVVGGRVWIKTRIEGTYGVYKGGIKRLITWVGTNYEYDDTSFEEFVSSRDVVFRYGVLKKNPSEGLKTLEEMNVAVEDDFDWYTNKLEAAQYGIVTAIMLDDPKWQGFYQISETYLNFNSTATYKDVNTTTFFRQKSYLYLDKERTQVETIYADNTVDSYKPDIYEQDVKIEDDSPEHAGVTLLQISNRADASIKTTSGKKSFDVSEEKISFTVTGFTVPSAYNDSVRVEDDVYFVVCLPSYLTYVPNSASMIPEYAVRTSNGYTYIKFNFPDLVVGDEIPTITLDAYIDPFTTNNKYMSVYVYSYSANYPFNKSKMTFTVDGVSYQFNYINSRDCGFYVTNLSGLSMRKTVSKKFLEVNETTTFTDTMYNVSDKNLENLKSIQRLPYDDDVYGSAFNGSYQLKVNSLAEGQKLYYSVSLFESLGVLETEGNVYSAKNIDFANNPQWIEVGVGDIIPVGATALASYVDLIETGMSKEFSYDFIPTGNTYYNVYGFRTFLTSTNLEFVTSTFIQNVAVGDRIIGGKVFIDQNNNDIYDDGERLYEGLTVNLLDGSKKKVDSTVTDENGAYKFTSLPKSDYYVQIESSDNYQVIKKNVGITSVSNVFNTDGYTDLITTLNNTLGVQLLEEPDINLGLRLKEATLTVHHYKEGTTTEMAPTETSTVYWGDKYSTKASTDIDSNYEVVGTPVNANGTVSGDVTVIYYYKLKEAKLTVHHYIKGTTTKLADSETSTLKYTDEYTTSKLKDIPNDYRYSSVDGIESGTISGDVTVIYYYELKEATLTVHHYIKGTTTKLADSETSILKYTDEYTTSKLKDIPSDYKYSSVDGAESGTISGDVIVIYYYELKEAKLTVHHYIKGTTTKLADSETSTLKYTDTYTTSRLSNIPSDYKYSSVDGNETGTIKGDVTVIYYYELKSATLTVHHYIKGTTTKLVESEVKTLKYTDEYTTSKLKDIPSDYKYSSVDGNETGTIKGNVTVIYYYELKSATLTVHHYIKGTTTKLADSETSTLKYTDTYTTSRLSNIPSDYKYSSVDGNETGTIKGDVTVIYYYELKSATLTVHHYIKGTTTKLADTETKTLKYTNEYTTKAATVDSNYKLSATPSNATGIINGDVTVIYYYELKEATLTVHHYIKGTTTKLADTETKTLKYTQEYETEAVTVDSNYKLSATPSNATGIINGDVTVIYYYELKEATLTVHHYIKGTTTKLAESEIKTLKYTEKYTTSRLANIPSDYKYSSVNGAESGTISGNVTVIYYYELKSATLTVHHYIKGTTTKLAESEVKTLKYTEKYTTSRLANIPSDYKYSSVDGAETGTIKGNVTVIYYYELKSATLTVHHYIKGTTTKLADTETKTLKYTDEYETKAATVDSNYKLVKAPDNASGTIKGDTVVIYYYELKGATLTVHHYIEGTTTELAESEVSTLKYTDEYTTKAATVDSNYELVKTPDNASGTIKGDTVVIYYYKLKTATLTVHHYIKGTTTKLAESEIKTLNYTDGYTTKLATVDSNYKLVEIPANANGVIKGDTVVIYYYELKGATLTVHHYIKGTTDKLANSEIYNKKYTDKYETSPSDKVSSDYKLVDTPDNESGTIKGDTIVIYYYELKEAKLTVHHYIKGTTDKLTDSEVSTLKYTNEYSTSPSSKVSTDYKVVGTPDNAKGIIKGDVTVIYYYELKDAKLTVHHYVEGTTTKLADSEEYNHKYRDEYSTKSSDKVSTDYKLVGTPDNATGTIKGDVTVIYYYRLKDATLTVHHYIEGTTDKLVDSETYGKKYRDEYSTSPSNKVSTNYRVSSNSGNTSGTIKGDTIVIYYYKLKEATLTVHHYIEGTTTKLVDSEVSTLKYTDKYSTSPSKDIDKNYEVVNDEPEAASGTIKGDVTVIYYYKLKTATLTVHHYIEGTTDKLVDSEVSTLKYTDSYSTSPSSKISSNYVLSSSNGSTSGVISGDVEVIYYYKLKSSILTIKYLEKDTNKPLSKEVTMNLKYTDEYETEEAKDIPGNYSFYSKTDNYKGIVNSDTIEVIYYYQKKDSKLQSTIDISEPKEITKKDQVVDYTVTYKADITDYRGTGTITIVTYLPYHLDVDKSDIDGGTYNNDNKTITWVIPKDDIDASSSTKEIEIIKNISVVFTDLDPEDRSMDTKATGNIVLDNNEQDVTDVVVTYIKIKGKIIVHHYIEDTKEKVVDDIITEELVGETYVSEAITKKGYELVKEPEDKNHTYIDGELEVIYEYKRLKYNIVTKVINGKGDVAGDEVVFYGDSSTEGKIVIRAAENHIIKRIVINGKEYEIDNDKEMILKSIENITEDYLIEVEFEEKIDNPETISSKIYLVIIGMIVLVIFIINRRKYLESLN